MPESPLRVVQYGLGPIGLECVRTVLGKPKLELVGAVDVDPVKVGRDAGELAGLDRTLGVTVSPDAAAVLAAARPDVVLHTTTSSLAKVVDQIASCVAAGAHVVSSTEELFFPFERHPQISARLDALAREHKVVVLGTGVNPGYVMDTLALAATGTCCDVRALRVERIVDAAKRRAPLQKKVGAGMTRAEFAERKAAGTIGHVGLMESLWYLAAGLGWKLDETEERLEPKLAERLVETPVVTVEPGHVAGIHHTASGRIGGREVLFLDLQMYVGADDPRDAVQVDGDPPVDLVIRGGVFGDTATVAALVNAIPLVRKAKPGLRTTRDLPLPRAFASSGCYGGAP